jgi:hypothetical protein
MEVKVQENPAIEMLQDAEHALKGFKKGSKLRDHYLKLVVMNNVFRAYVVIYELPPEYKEAQEGLLKVLRTVEGRRNRAVFLNEHPLLDAAFDKYRTLLDSSEPHEITEILEFVDHQRDAGRWIVSHRKTFQKVRLRNGTN